MKSSNLEAGWLSRQMAEVSAEVRNWPKDIRALRSLNDSISRTSNVDGNSIEGNASTQHVSPPGELGKPVAAK